MFLVVSEWEPYEGQEEEFDRRDGEVAAILRRQPGVVMLEMFASDRRRVAVHGYENEAVYRGLIDDPDGEFARSMREREVERFGRWVRSVSGPTVTY